MKQPNVILVLAIFFISFGETISLPRFALQQKDKCSSCHVNPTGGMMRNENGFFFGKNVVGMISPHDKDFKLSPKLSENVSFGFDYRTQYLYSQEFNKTDFQDMTGSVYLNAAISQSIDLLARYDFVQALWEGYAVARVLPNESYIKIGSFIPYFGIRLDDHTAYTRGGDFGLLSSKGITQGLIYNPLYIETGIEVGVNLSDNTFLTASVGKPRRRASFSTDPTYTARLEFNPKIEKFDLLFGAAYASIKTRSADGFLKTNFYGGFAGIGYKRFSLTGEYDIAEDYLKKDVKSSAIMVEAAYQLMAGLDAIVRYDYFDPNLHFEKDQHARLVFGFEFFPYSFVELRPQYRIGFEEPDAKNNSFVLQFHFWY